MIKKITNALLALCILLVIWQISSIMLDKSFLPSVYEASSVFVKSIKDGSLIYHGWISFYRVFISIVLAFVLALPLGYVMGRIKWVDAIFSPLLYLLYPLPKVVFLPIIVVMMGLGNAPKIFLITLVVFFQILVVVRDGVRSVPKENIESLQALKASKWQEIYYLYWPYLLPKVLTALRITLGTAIAILFFSETFASFNGLGYFILNGMECRNYALMYAGIMAMACLGLFLYLLVDVIEAIFCKWQKY